MTGIDVKGRFPDATMNGEGIPPDFDRMPAGLRAACRDAIDRIVREKEKKQRILVAIDGPCASGKSTLAGILARVFGAGTVHTDDFVIPHWLKTPERLQVPGGNLDDQRLIGEVLEPWKREEYIIYQRYDCHDRRYVPADPIPRGDMLILEGSCALLPSLRVYADVRLFMTAPWEIRKERLIKRESPESFERFTDMWIPLENAYFEAYGLPDGECAVIMG